MAAQRVLRHSQKELPLPPGSRHMPKAMISDSYRSSLPSLLLAQFTSRAAGEFTRPLCRRYARFHCPLSKPDYCVKPASRATDGGCISAARTMFLSVIGAIESATAWSRVAADRPNDAVP